MIDKKKHDQWLNSGGGVSPPEVLQTKQGANETVVAFGTYSITFDSIPTDGNLILFVFSINASRDFTPPSGFAGIDSGGSPRLYIFTKTAASEAGAQYDFVSQSGSTSTTRAMGIEISNFTSFQQIAINSVAGVENGDAGSSAFNIAANALTISGLSLSANKDVISNETGMVNIGVTTASRNYAFSKLFTAAQTSDNWNFDWTGQGNSGLVTSVIEVI